MRKSIASVLAVSFLTLSIGCSVKAPKREHIPVLKEMLFKLQQAVKAQDRAAIDSLLSVRIISNNQNSDSLLRFVYGPDNDFAFERFGNYDIVYTGDKARIDCLVMDTTSSPDRPVTFALAYEHDLWLLTSFEPGRPQVEDSL